MRGRRVTTARSRRNSNGCRWKMAKFGSAGSKSCLSGFTSRSSGGRRCVTARIRTSRRRFTFRRASLRRGLAGAKQLQGKELSYNNLVDLDSAWALAREFERAGVAIIKHNNPCGAAEQDSLREAYLKALECDPVSAFGGVMAFNRAIDAATAEEVAKLFVECIVAPGFEAAALEKFAAKKNLRLLEMPAARCSGRARDKTHFRRRARAGAGPPRTETVGPESGDGTRAERCRNSRAAIRMESLQAREIERDRIRARGADGGYRRRADEPRGFGEDRGDQSGHGGTFVERVAWSRPMRSFRFPMAWKKQVKLALRL